MHIEGELRWGQKSVQVWGRLEYGQQEREWRESRKHCDSASLRLVSFQPGALPATPCQAEPADRQTEAAPATDRQIFPRNNHEEPCPQSLLA